MRSRVTKVAITSGRPYPCRLLGRWGKLVRRIFFGIALSVVLTGSFAGIANAQTGTPQKNPIPSGLIKNCVANIVKDNPKTKIVGPFAPVFLTMPFQGGRPKKWGSLRSQLLREQLDLWTVSSSTIAAAYMTAGMVRLCFDE